MKGWQVGLAAVLMSFMLMGRADATTQSDVLFSEVQTGSKTSAAEDFVELLNQSDSDIDLTTWRLEYHTAGSLAKWAKKAQLLGSIPAHGHYLVSSKGYLDDISDATFTSGLSMTGGSLRLVRVGQNGGVDEIADLVGWGKAAVFEGSQAGPSPANGQSLVRRTSGESLLDTDNNDSDFSLSDSPTPQSETTPAEPATDADTDPLITGTDQTSIEAGPDGTTSTEVITSPEVNADVWITELLVDPASPQTDADDEFIELYNAGDQVADLDGYVLQTGLTFSHTQVIKGLQIEPGQYHAVYSSETGLSLSNSGGQARLVSPSGVVIYETKAYSSAKSGQSFVLGSDDSWQWTTQPTPGAANIISQPATVASPAKTTTKTAAKKATATKAKTVTKPKSTKTTSSNLATTTPLDQNAKKSLAQRLNPVWLVGIGSLGVLYGAYEYREDIVNKFHQFRRNRKARHQVGR